MTRIWKLQYEFADAGINCLRDSSTRRDSYVFALLRCDTVKAADVLFPSFWFYERNYFCH